MTSERRLRRAWPVLLLTLVALSAVAQDRPVVTTASYPLAYFAERLTGEAADVVFPVPAGSDPSFWRPAIPDIAAIQAADLIVLNGAGFAAWTTKVSLPRSRTVDTSAGFADRFIATETVTHSHGAEGAHSHTGTASYTWMDFALAARQAEALAAALTRRMPEAQAGIDAALDELRTDLSALDAKAARIGTEAQGLSAIASHPRYQYFARAYGLDLSAVDWDAREEVGEDQWEALAVQVAKTGATLFIWEAEPAQPVRQRLQAMGVVDVVFPPLANAPNAEDFVSSMSSSLDRLETSIMQAAKTPR